MGTASTTIRARRIFLAVCLTLNYSLSAWAQEPTLSPGSTALESPQDEKPQFAEFGAFDGDSSATNTPPQAPPFGGPLGSRLKLTGDWCCWREDLRDCGYTFDISTTEYFQGIAAGG